MTDMWRHGTLRMTVRGIYRLTIAACMLAASLSLGGSPVLGDQAHRSSDWYWENPLPHAYSIQAIACPTIKECVAGGPGGAITTTADGGYHWKERSTRTDADLFGIVCSGPTICYAAGNQWDSRGNGNVLLKSTDGGVSWFQPSKRLPIEQDESLGKVICASRTICFAISFDESGNYATALRTVDGGMTWRAVSGSAVPAACPTGNVCYGWSAHTLFRSEDAGRTWKRWHRFKGPPGEFLAGMVCPRAGICIVAVAACPACDAAQSPDAWATNFFRTGNGGSTWTRAGHVGGVVESLVCGSARRCYGLVPASGVIETTDGGESWHSQVLPFPGYAFQLSCPGPTTCYGTVDYTAIKTTDAFHHIRQTPARSSLVGGGFYSISCPDVTTCYASNFASSGSLALTRDGGRTWSAAPGAPPPDLVCPTPMVCYSFSDLPGATQSQDAYLFRTTDGAKSWQSFPLPVPGVGPDSADFTCVDDVTCFVLAASPADPSHYVLLRTEDAGTSWSVMTGINDAIEPATFISFPGSLSCPTVSTCFVTTSRWSGDTTPPTISLLKSTDAGTSWRSSAPPPCTARCDGSGLDCPTVTTCYVVSISGTPASPSPTTALVTHDAGATWSSARIGPRGFSFLTGIACADSQNCRVITSADIYATADGGGTWHKETVQGGNGSATLRAVACPAADTCYAVGDEMTILGTRPAGGQNRAGALTMNIRRAG